MKDSTYIEEVSASPSIHEKTRDVICHRRGGGRKQALVYSLSLSLWSTAGNGSICLVRGTPRNKDSMLTLEGDERFIASLMSP